MKTRRELIEDTIQDLVGSFLYYDRKEDEDLSVREIENAIAEGEISVDEIVSLFRKFLTTNLPKTAEKVG